MDQRKPLDFEILRRCYVLPDDVSMIPVASLPPDTRDKIHAFEEDIALTRRSVRSPTQVIDPELAKLLETFRTPSTIVSAIARFSGGRLEEAEAVLEEAMPVFIDLINRSILVCEEIHANDTSLQALLPETRFEGLTITRCLQQFSDSAVYQVQDDEGRFHVLKLAAPDCSESIRHRLANEITILEHLRRHCSASAPVLVDHGQWNSQPWILVKWINGISVDRHAAELRALGKTPELIGLAADIVAAYRNLHSANVGHGDVHPNNILVSADGSATIIDFGLAALFDSNGPYERGGVAFYAEPEFARCQLEHLRPPRLSSKGEQFSIAALLYELMTGRHYHDFDLEHDAMYRAIALAQPAPIELADGKSASELEHCLFRALSIKAADRYPDLLAFEHQLRLIAVPGPRKINSERKIEPLLRRFQSASWERALSGDPEQIVNAFDHGPVASLNGGAAGVAYALHRLACMDSSPTMHARSIDWIACAERHQDDTEAYHDRAHEPEFQSVGPCSVHHGPTGIAFVQALLALSVNDGIGAEQAVQQFLLDSESPGDAWDTTLGRLSVVMAACELLDSVTGDVAHEGALAARAVTLMSDVWQERIELAQHDLFAAMGAMSLAPNLGLAHGWTGLCYSALRLHSSAGIPLPERFDECVEALSQHLQPAARGLSLPWRDAGSASMNSMPGWCNGAAGAVHLYTQLYEQSDSKRWLNTAEALAWNVWESRGGPIDLCCGHAGRIIALLAVHKVTGNEAWLERATMLAEQAVRQLGGPSMWSKTANQDALSLFKGELGLALAVHAVLDPDQASMPMMGIAA